MHALKSIQQYEEALDIRRPFLGAGEQPAVKYSSKHMHTFERLGCHGGKSVRRATPVV